MLTNGGRKGESSLGASEATGIQNRIAGSQRWCNKRCNSATALLTRPRPVRSGAVDPTPTRAQWGRGRVGAGKRGHRVCARPQQARRLRQFSVNPCQPAVRAVRPPTYWLARWPESHGGVGGELRPPTKNRPGVRVSTSYASPRACLAYVHARAGVGLRGARRW
jgi:hypothetical protein